MAETDKYTAFEALVKRHKDMLWRLCSNYRFSEALLTEDAFQEVLCVLWRDFGGLRKEDSERAWVFRAATTTLLMLKRRPSNQPQADPEEPIEAVVPDGEGYETLQQLIRNLKEPDRRIVQAFVEGFSYKEIAAILGMSVPNVAMRLSRAKKKLRKQYNALL